MTENRAAQLVDMLIAENRTQSRRAREIGTGRATRARILAAKLERLKKMAREEPERFDSVMRGARLATAEKT